MMKKITTLLMMLLMVTLGFSQQQQYLFDFESGDPDGTASNWITFDNSPPPAEIIDNPDLDGVNATASKVLKVTVGPDNAFYAGVNNAFAQAAFGTWEIDMSVQNNLSVSIDINKNYVGTVGIKMGTTTGGTTFQITDQNVGNTVVDEWQTLTWDLSNINPNGDLTNISQFVVFVDWTEGQPDRAPNSVIHIDNITFNANKLTDPPAPTCTDGFQNGQETGVDCGGPDCDPCIVNPTTASPQQASTGTNLYVYSDLTGSSVTNFNFNAFSGSATITEVDIETNGNNAGKIDSGSNWFYGAEWDAEDLATAGFTHVHLNYYATTSSQFNFYLIDKSAGIPGGNSAEPRYSFGDATADATLVAGSWQSVFIPLQHFLNYDSGTFSYDLNDIFQYKFDGNGTIYFDNIYFSTSSTLSNDSFSKAEFKVYPNPTKDSWNIQTTENIKNVQVFNITGRLVKEVKVNASETVINTNGLSSGVYLAKISNEFDQTKTIKLIKE